MIARCNYEKTRFYKWYGGKGIRVEDRWLEFENFHNDMIESFELHVKEHGKDNTSLDRIDSNGNYSKQNCKWATWKEQQNNKSSTKKFFFNNEYLTAEEITKLCGINKSTFWNRIYAGKSVEEAVATRSLRCKLTVQQVEEIRSLYAQGKFSYGKLGKMYGVNTTTIESAVKRQNWK